MLHISGPVVVESEHFATPFVFSTCYHIPSNAKKHKRLVKHHKARDHAETKSFWAIMTRLCSQYHSFIPGLKPACPQKHPNWTNRNDFRYRFTATCSGMLFDCWIRMHTSYAAQVDMMPFMMHLTEQTCHSKPAYTEPSSGRRRIWTTTREASCRIHSPINGACP